MYEFPGHYLKFNFPDGEIDFLTGTQITDDPTSIFEFKGSILRIDNPWETITKKIFYRAPSFKVRDVFDTAAVIVNHPEELITALTEVEDKIDILIKRVELLAPRYADVVQKEVNPTKTGSRYMEQEAAQSVLDFLGGWSPRPSRKP